MVGVLTDSFKVDWIPALAMGAEPWGGVGTGPAMVDDDGSMVVNIL